jgi:O-antigen/teichoic acid export membrane protein
MRRKITILPLSTSSQASQRIELAAEQGYTPCLLSGTEGLPIELIDTLILPAISNIKESQKSQPAEENGESYATQIQSLIKSSGIYILASVASPLVSLILMPFLTHTLSRDEYGALAVLNTAISLLAGITQFGLNNAFFRAYSCDYEAKQDKLDIVSTVVVLLLFISLPVTLFILLTAPWLSNILLNTTSYGNAIRLAALIILAQNLTVPGLSWLRAENRAAIYSILSIANLLINLGGAIIFVGLLHMGLMGALLAIGGGYTTIVIATLPVILIRTGLHLRFDITHNLLSFGLPLVSSFVSVWILQLSDRYLLSHFASLAQTASYSVAYSLGGLLNVVILSPFSLAWPTTSFAIAKRKDAPRIYQQVFRWYIMVLLLSSFAFSLASTIVFLIFFPVTYHSAASIIPIVTLSSTFFGIYSFYNTGIAITRKTWLAVVFTTIAAIINIGFNLVLIPAYGSMGAAWSTLLAYAILTVIAYFVNQRIYPIPFELDILVVGLLAGILLYVGGSFLSQGHGQYVAWGIILATFVLYCFLLILLNLFSIKRSKKQVYEK